MTAALSVLLTLVPSVTVLAESSLPAAVLALALAALWTVRRSAGAVLASAVHPPPGPSYADRSVLRTLVTDPVHHPRRPRAPGTA